MDRRFLLILPGLLVGAVAVSVMAVAGRLPGLSAVVSSDAAARAVAADANSLAFANGDTVADFQLPDVAGGSVQLAATHGQRRALLFVSATCPYCTRLEERLAGAQVAPGAQIVVICKGDTAQVSARVGAQASVLADTAGAVSALYGVHSVPAAYLLDAKGEVVATAVGLGRAEELLGRLVTWCGGDCGS